MLCDPVLDLIGIPHGFAERGAPELGAALFARQVHGVAVVRGEDLRDASGPVEADAVTSRTPGLGAGIVTADCVPILAAACDGTRVVAIHAGWRGLAAGVIDAGIAALGVPQAQTVAAIGPAARGCCYEVDEPVATALAVRYADLLEGLLVATRTGHHLLDLSGLAARVLIRRIGIPPDGVGVAHALCTICTPGRRFESHRRDRDRAGRGRHFISPIGG